MSQKSNLLKAKTSLETALGGKMKMYLELLKSWFKRKMTKEEFDFEARKLLTDETVHLHNQFLLAILDSIPYTGVNEGVRDQLKIKNSTPAPRPPPIPAQLPTQLSSAKDPKAFLAVDPLISAVPCDALPGDYQIEYMVQSLLLPDFTMLQGRLLVAAWSVGLDDVTTDAVDMLSEALQVMLKNIVSAVISRRKGYLTRNKSFQYGFTNSLPSCFTQNFAASKSSTNEGDMVGDYMRDIPSADQKIEDYSYPARSAREARFCSAPPVFKISLLDLYDTLKVSKGILPSHTVYTTALETISNSMTHPPRT